MNMTKMILIHICCRCVERLIDIQTRYPRNVAAFIFFLLIATSQSMAQVQYNHASGKGWHVDISEVIPQGATAAEGYQIHLSYAFAGSDSVWLQGVGPLEPSGAFTYVIRKDDVVFRSAKAGGLLASVKIRPTNFDQPPPHGDQYPSPVPPTIWRPAQSFNLQVDAKKAMDVLRCALVDTTHRYPTSCAPYDQLCWLSPWTLVTSDPNIQGEVSVMLIFAGNQGGPSPIVKILYTTRQGYVGSDQWDNDGGKVVDDATVPFLTRLQNSIQQNAAHPCPPQ
jgi:hypothetical protein